MTHDSDMIDKDELMAVATHLQKRLSNFDDIATEQIGNETNEPKLPNFDEVPSSHGADVY